jgi:hypothetical protein
MSVLAGIYSLERLARDSVKDQPTTIEILSAFVRTQALMDSHAFMPELFGQRMTLKWTLRSCRAGWRSRWMAAVAQVRKPRAEIR